MTSGSDTSYSDDYDEAYTEVWSLGRVCRTGGAPYLPCPLLHLGDASVPAVQSEVSSSRASTDLGSQVPVVVFDGDTARTQREPPAALNAGTCAKPYLGFTDAQARALNQKRFGCR